MPPTAHHDKYPVANFAAALARLGGDRKLLTEMMTIFVEDTPELLVVIENSLAENNAATARRACHSIKGLAANFDGRRVSEIAERMEQAAHQEKLSELRTMLNDLRTEIRHLEAEFSAYQA